MAIIYTYPNLPLSSLSADDLLVITNVDANNNNPTKSVTLADIATYVTGTGSGTGTTNKIVKFTDGANGLLGDSIMTESTGLIDLAGQFVSTSSPTLTQAGPVSGIKAILNGTTAAPNVALYGESKNTGSTQADSNYGLYAKGEFEGTGGFTGFAIGGSLEGRYDGTGTNGANATVYGSYNLARATTAANGTISYMIGANNLAKLEGANVTATNLQATHSTVELSNGTAGDVIVQILDFDTSGGGTVTGDFSYLQIQNDTMPTVAGTSRAINSKSVLPSLFTGQVEIPLVPTINAHATSKQYVDQQISSVVSGLVFQSTWDASSTPGGNPDLTAADKKVVGHYYVVSVAGSATPNGAGTLPNSWNVGDWCIYVEQGATDRWEKLDQTFVSGAGAAGQVTYWNSQNEVAGDNDLFFDSTNKRLGIGTTSPATVLDVNGGLNADHATFSGQAGRGLLISTKNITNNDDGVVYNAQTSTGTHLFHINGVEKMRIDSSGNVGIGTTSPGSKLEISDTSDPLLELNGGATANPFMLFAQNGTRRAFIQYVNGGVLSLASEYGYIRFMTGTGGVETERMRIDSAGDIFISPRATAASSGSGILYFKNVDDNSATINGGSIRTVDSTNNPSGADMRFQVANDAGTLFDAVTIDSNGFMGIGTTAPDYNLDVSTSARINSSLSNAVQLVIDNSNTTDAGTETSEIRFRHYRSYVAGQNDAGSIIVGKEEPWDAAGDRNSYMSFSTRTGTAGATEKMRINASGDVGIGTLPHTAGNTWRTLYVGSSATILSRQAASGTDTIFGNNSYINSSNVDKRITTGGASRIFMNQDVVRFQRAASDSSDTTISWSESMRIDSSGDVGIGTTSPQSGGGAANWLSLNGTAAYSGGIVYTINSTTKAYSYFESDYLKQQAQSGFGQKFIVDGTNTAMTILDSGNVGIGTTNPGSKLDVSSSSTSIIRLSNSDTTLTEGQKTGSLEFYQSDTSGNGTGVTGRISMLSAKNGSNPNYYGNAADMIFQVAADPGFADDNATLNALTIKNSSGNVGIGTTSPGSLLSLQKDDSTVYDPTSDDGQRAIGPTILLNNNNTTTNTFGQIMYDTDTSGQGVARIVFLDAGSASSAIAFVTEQGNSVGERMRIDSSGNLVVGGTSAISNSKLNVFSNGSSDDVLRINADDARGASRYALHIADSDPNSRGSLRIDTTSGASITTTNAVGIGTISPDVKLEVIDASPTNGIIADFVNSTNAGGTTAAIKLSNADSNVCDVVLGANRVGGDFGSDFFISLSDNVDGSDQERFRITESGNVGIGTTSPFGAAANRTAFSVNGTNDVTLNIGTGDTQRGYMYSDGTQTRIATVGAIPLTLGANDTEKMRITSSGDVLVGTTTAISTGNGLSINSTGQMRIGRASTGSIKQIIFSNPNDEVGSISTSGSATAFNTSSDYRLKEDLKDFDGLDKVSKIPVYDFKWKVDDSRSYGVMAHELQEVVPNAVNGEKDAEEMQGVDYSKIVPLLIKSIQELEAKVKILENK